MQGVKCEPITQGSDRLCTRRCVHGQLPAHLLSMSTKVFKSPSTNQMEADQTLTNRSKEHWRACGASRTEDLTNSQKKGEIIANSRGFRFSLRGEGEDGRGVLIFFRSQCSIGLEDTSEKIGSTIAEDFKKFVELKTSIWSFEVRQNRFRFRNRFVFFFFLLDLY